MRKPRRKPIDRSDGFVIFGYLQHWACFHCRKTFKSGTAAAHLERLCPQCRAPMTNMGTDFKAPAQTEVGQWRKVQLLAQAGVRFSPRSPAQLPGERPATLAEVPAFLKRLNPPSAGVRLLERNPSQRLAAPREGRLVQHGSFPNQSYSLLGKALESGAALELFDAGQWQAVGFVSKGSGARPTSQPCVYARIADHVYWNHRPLFLTPEHRLRWPQP